ncbi:efflux RND transporter periplasmic adaptor subunit [Sinirhodobacter sp. WL0062]|uniref:Efflux RND transporter periplasmic adaptor subunit n=1 Tax=Rhodobacter flavimaris TaxID=2907145 RepID=A0ABS8Z339_9RHOB|nr:efflux RND transporter periplasmic adaptor subunit [Sinirhodobacter sp. WL0062]MCE5974345.1 efflux RND transporter periplasmic adaptor subunit [Sinirhodobacter sp. WL0062]
MIRPLLPLMLAAALCSPVLADQPRPVVSEILTREAVALRAYPGEIAAKVETTLAFQTAGRIATRPVRLGDLVATGDELATLDQITLGEDVSAARAAVDSAQAQLDFAQQSLTRARELHARNVASQAALEAATAQAESAEGSLRAARANLTRALDAERFGTLRAPASGVITAIFVEPGAEVSAGTPVLMLATDQGREAVIDVPEEVVGLLSPEARFVIAPRTLGAAPIGGTLRLIEPVADKSIRNRRLRITLSPEATPPRLGTLVDARLDQPGTPILTLPVEALLETGDTVSVWRVASGRVAERVTITPGARIDNRVTVREGLSEGDEILIRGIHSVSEGEILGEREQ